MVGAFLQVSSAAADFWIMIGFRIFEEIFIGYKRYFFGKAINKLALFIVCLSLGGVVVTLKAFQY